MPLLLATANPHKQRELQALLPEHALQCAPHSLHVEEPAQTFVENALLKARAYAAAFAQPCLADDSGLCVAALHHQPGVQTADYAQIHGYNGPGYALVLSQLNALPEASRQAFFYCVLVYVRSADDPCPLIATGRLDGVIAPQASGTQGFAYDVIFCPEHDQQRTLGEYSLAEKNQISARAKAALHLRSLWHAQA